MAYEEKAWKTLALLIHSLGIEHLAAKGFGSET
jgi:hypothetical protein